MVADRIRIGSSVYKCSKMKILFLLAFFNSILAEFYAELGITKDADLQAIKRAYKKLAKKTHPDVNRDDPG